MSTITTRAGKGSPLSNAEMDANLNNLNDDKVESNTISSVDGELALFSGTGGKTIKRATTTGILKATSGVPSAATAGTDYVAPATATTFTAPQRGTITTDNDGSFNQAATNNFFCTPTGAVALTFTTHTAGQSGLVLFVNTTNYAITAAATTYIAAADLTKLSATGTYLIAYLDNGTNAYCTVTAALTSAGV